MKKILKYLFVIFLLFIPALIPAKGETYIFTGKYKVNAQTHNMELFLIQNGDRVTGTYDVPLGSGNFGYLTGSVNDNRLNFKFVEVMYGQKKPVVSGTGYLILDKKNNGFAADLSGYYSEDKQDYKSKWTGKRIY